MFARRGAHETGTTTARSLPARSKKKARGGAMLAR